VVSAGAAARRVLPAVAAAAAVAALLAGIRERPHVTRLPDAARRPPATPATTDLRGVSARRPSKPGPVRSATASATTPFSFIEVRVTLTGDELTRVETVSLTSEGPHTQALNSHAEPILRAEALKAGSADIDVVSGATYTSESYKDSLQAAIDKARG
jgi:uncharacterized protein with FMN-binding domain